MALLPAAEAAQVLRGLIWPAEGLVPELYYLQLSELRPDAIWVLHPVMSLLFWMLL